MTARLVANRLGSLAILPLAVGGVVSLWGSDFVPSVATVFVAVVSAGIVGTFYGAFFSGIHGFGWSDERPAAHDALRRYKVFRNPFVRGLFMGLVFFCFAWLSFSSAFPWVLNMVAGSQGTMIAVVDGWQESSHSARSRQCSRPTLRHVPFGMLGRYALCFNYSSADRSALTPGTPVELSGRRSWFGVSPTGVSLLKSPPAA